MHPFYFFGRMRLREVMDILDGIAPFETAQDWDNVGIMVGDPDQEIRSILVALDPSFPVLCHAKETETNLILTHHPLFFHPLRCLNLQDATARKTALLIENNMALVSMHSNLDAAPGGVADVLATCLGLKDAKAFGLLRLGFVEPQPLHVWVRSLPFGTARLCYAGRDVCKVASCPGSGMDLWSEALQAGCDTLVTGDVRYHIALEAHEAGINVVDLGHFETEMVVVKPLVERLHRELPALDIRAFEDKDIFMILE